MVQKVLLSKEWNCNLMDFPMPPIMCIWPKSRWLFCMVCILVSVVELAGGSCANNGASLSSLKVWTFQINRSLCRFCLLQSNKGKQFKVTSRFSILNHFTKISGRLIFRQFWCCEDGLKEAVKWFNKFFFSPWSCTRKSFQGILL